MICYIPIGQFYKNQGLFPIAKYASTEPIQIYKEDIHVDFDASSQYSDEPITVSDPFLDAVLKKEFGGFYSERDLSQISSVSVWYYPTEERISQSGAISKSEPSIQIHFYNRELADDPFRGSLHVYSDYFEEGWSGEFPMEILNDMERFPLLESVQLFQRGKENKVPFPEGYLDRILTKEYTAEDFE